MSLGIGYYSHFSDGNQAMVGNQQLTINENQYSRLIGMKAVLYGMLCIHSKKRAFSNESDI